MSWLLPGGSVVVELLGERQATFRSVQDVGSRSGGAEAAALMRAAGVELYDWQQDVLADWLAEDDNGWVHSNCCLVVPRQNGKSMALVARILYGLFLVESERLILYSAHQFKTAEETWRLVRELVQNTPGLAARVARNGIRNSHGQEGLELVDGSRLRIVARTNSPSSQGRGFSPDCVILDEAMILGDESWSAILPALSARPNPQVLLASSAGLVESQVLARFRDMGREGANPRLAYHEWCAVDGDDRGDRRVWAQANPGLGVSPRLEFVEQEFASMPAAEFDRERLGVWAAAARSASALDVEAFADCVTGEVERPGAGGLVLAVDVHTRLRGQRDAAIVAAWSRGQVVESVVVQAQPGVRWLPERLLELCAEHGVSRVHMSVGGAKDVADELEAAGVQLQSLPRDGFKAACMGLAQAVTDRTVRVQASPGLAAAVSATPARQFPDGGWQFDSRRVDVSVAPLVAWAVAVQAARAHAEYDVMASVF